ncbi:MAG TPA: hypothetical protein VJK25_00925 [Patescibacteria group bacterium]|nr:hypothetical protein [Patescibacteria group bacterium]
MGNKFERGEGEFPEKETREQLVGKALDLLNKEGGWGAEDLMQMDVHDLRQLIGLLSSEAPETSDQIVASADPEEKE